MPSYNEPSGLIPKKQVLTQEEQVLAFYMKQKQEREDQALRKKRLRIY